MAERAKAKKEAKPTEYVVLEQRKLTSNEDGWVEVGTTEAKSTVEKSIVRAVVGDRAGTFKAVAIRSWKGAISRQQETIWKDEVIL